MTVALLGTLGVAVRDRIAEQRSWLTIAVLSSRPDMITGGNARIRVTKPEDVRLGDVRVSLDGTDVTSQFTLTDVGLEGVVRGLSGPTNLLQATAPKVQPAMLTLTNRPLSGPIFSGSQQQPFVCESPRFRTRTGVRLGPPLDATCTIAPATSYVYFSTAQKKFLPLGASALTDRSRRPKDLGSVTLPDGTRQLFVVKVETRTINRGIAQIAMLAAIDGHDPIWNRKLIYVFGGSCGVGYRQGVRAVGILSPRLLAQGYATASNSLNAAEQNCNDVVAAESIAMTREHFIETYGEPAYTMGIGCSGGAAQAYQTADNYPGLLDGLVVGCSLADLGFDVGQLAFDARLLQQYAQRFPDRLSADQLEAVSGLPSAVALKVMSEWARILDPVAGFDPVVPAALRYDPVRNIGGARASIWDQYRNVYGSAGTPSTARRPLGNVGVQYGLAAFKAGVIGPEEFVALNSDIGGLDGDLNRTVLRTSANAQATRIAYTTGRVLNGGGGLGDIPIIDYRAHEPQTARLDLAHHTFSVRERLIAANGDADNQVLLSDSGRGRFDLERGVVPLAIAQMDRWITAMRSLPYSGHHAAITSKPSDLVDACWTSSGTKIVEPQVYQGRGRCAKLYPAHATPRMVAGGPLSSNVISCSLTDIDPKAYPQRLTAVQLKRMQRAFPEGVCDWQQRGTNRRVLDGPWQTF